MWKFVIATMSVAVLIAGCAQPPVVKEEVKPAVKEAAKPAVKPLTEEEAKKTGLHGTSEALIYWSGKAARDLAEAKKIAPAPVTEVKAEYALSKEDFEKMRQVYFDRCAGCHGVLRKGATGKALTPDKTRPQGSAILRAFIYTGTGGGMPGWGKQGVLSDAETDLMVKYIQNDPPIPPQWSLPDMKKSWKVLIPPEKRPTAPQHKRDWQNFFVVTLRDAGKIAIIDGDTKEVVNTVDSGYAVHIVRMSMSGRYVYTIGRDGKATIIDLWMEKPDTVAEIRTGLDARSIDVSKYTGFEDKYAVVGCYWPPQFVILDGATLEPIKIVSTLSYTYDTEEYHPEPRVASIVASHFRPEWVVNIKETGQIWLVDYSDPSNPGIKMIEAERFLHDGGWDASKRYFLVGANMKNKVSIVDTKERKLVANVETGIKPHPGRGANWTDSVYGPVWATGHLGEGLMAVIGTDPEKYPQNAWKVVRRATMLGGGNLFIKTHPNSNWIWVDHTLHADDKIKRSIGVYDRNNIGDKLYKSWEVADYGRAVHFEYNKAGDEVWVSVWGRMDVPGKVGEIVVYDDKTLAEKARIKNLVTPTGKFNVYNTVHDIY